MDEKVLASQALQLKLDVCLRWRYKVGTDSSGSDSQLIQYVILQLSNQSDYFSGFQPADLHLFSQYSTLIQLKNCLLTSPLIIEIRVLAGNLDY